MKQTEDIKLALRNATLLLLLTAQGEADVSAGRTLPHSEVFERIREHRQRERTRLLRRT